MKEYEIRTVNDLKKALTNNCISGSFTINEEKEINEWVMKGTNTAIKLLISRFKLIKILKELDYDLKSIYVQRATGRKIDPAAVNENEAQEIISVIQQVK